MQIEDLQALYPSARFEAGIGAVHYNEDMTVVSVRYDASQPNPQAMAVAALATAVARLKAD